MERESRRWALLLLVAASLIAVGCGGDDGEDTGAAEPSAEAPEQPAEPAPPTKQEYLAEADQICKKADAHTDKLSQDINSELSGELQTGTSPEAQTASAKKVSDLFEELADARDATTKDLEQLEAPAEGPPAEYLKSRENVTDATRDDAKAYAALADELTQEFADEAAASVEKSNQLRDAATKLAKDYGFKVCSQPTK